MQQVDIQWRAWHGDQTITLIFPPAWKITIHGNRHVLVMDSGDLRQKICNPIGTLPLHILARKRKSAAIVIDDITRPTPTALLLPLVIQELERGGMGRDAVTIVIGSGAHQKASHEDILKKVGPSIAEAFTVVAHDSEKDTRYWGTSADGVPLHLNRRVMACELKIGLGSILPHPFAGFSGGSKSICPGICGPDTIRYLHDYMNDYQHDYTTNIGWSGRSTDNHFRRTIDRIVGEIGLDFIVNAVLNGRREISGLFAGHRTGAFDQGKQMAGRLYGADRSTAADIIIANTYPFDQCLRYMLRGLWPFVGSKPNAKTVVIGAAPEGIGSHGLKTTAASLLIRAWRRLKQTRPHLLRHDVKIGISILKKRANQKKQHHLFLCPGLSNDDLTAIFPSSRRFDSWTTLLSVLEDTHKGKNATAAIYPYASLQFPKQNGERL